MVHKIKQLSIYFIATFFIFNCSCSQLYDDMEAEDLEILYENGKEDFLPLLCYKYADIYITTDIINEDEQAQSFFNYCSHYYDKSEDKKAAYYLSLYYKVQALSDSEFFINYLYYLRLSGDEEEVMAFIENDSKIFAIIDHSLLTLSLIEKVNKIETMVAALTIVNTLFDKYIQDMRQIERLSFLQDKKESIEFNYAEINDTIRKLKEELMQLMIIAKQSQGYSGYPRIDLNTQIEIIIKGFNSSIYKLQTSLNSLSRLNNEVKNLTLNFAKIDKKILAQTSDILNDFQTNKKNYQEDYEKIYQKKVDSYK